MLSRVHRHRASEQGATAILTAVLAVAMFGMAAIAVDLGNAFARKGDTQVQADFAALAGAASLPDANDTLQAVAQYLIENAARDDAGTTTTALSTMVGRLTDGNFANGEVEFLGRFEIRVTTPTARVNFGFGGIFAADGGGGASGVGVSSRATVLVGSPKGNMVLPAYVANPTPGNPGCDYGLQTLTDPPGGHVVPPNVPPLAYDTDSNDNKLTGIQTFEGGLPTTSLQVDSTTGTTTIYGDFKDATRVGFFRSDDPTAPVVEVPRSSWTAPAGTGPYTANNASITVAIPTTVTAVDTLWYVRVYQAGTKNKWSARNEAQPLSVGDAPFECVGGSESGNFGTLKMPRGTADNSTADGWIARNIALGLDAPLSLDIFPLMPPPWQCHSGMAEAVISDSQYNRNPGTNCLDTDTGMTHQTATPGFITGMTGVGAYEGLLVAGSSSQDPDGSGGCSPDGDVDSVELLGKHLNNDILTCFLTDTTTALGDVARKSYAGGPKFHPEIYESPRFAWVPVFKQETDSGGSGYYSIVDFRPAFISDQPMTATKANNTVGTSTVNGLGITGGRLETLKIIFLNPRALPEGTAETPIGPYLGVGPQIIRLVD